MPRDLLEDLGLPSPRSKKPIDLLEAYGIKPPPRKPSKGWKGISEDVLEGISDIPDVLMSIPHAIPEFFREGGRAVGQLATNPIRAGKNLLAGGGEFLQNAYNLPNEAGQYFEEKGLSHPFKQYEPSELNFLDMLGIEGQQPGDEFIRALSSSGPLLAASELGSLGTLARMGSRGLGAGVDAALHGGNPVTGFGSAVGAEGLIRGLGKGLNQSLPSGSSSPQERAINQRAAQGTSIPLTKILGMSSANKTIENWLDHVFGSGATGRADKVSKQIEGKAESLLPPENFESGVTANMRLKDDFKAAQKKQQDISNSLYADVDPIFEQSGGVLDLKQFQNVVNKNLDALNESPILKNDDRIRKLIKQLSRAKESSKLPGKNKLSDAKQLAATLSEKADEMKKSPNSGERANGDLLRRLSNAIRSDVRNSINSVDNPELHRIFDTAEKNYKKNYAPFKDPEVQKIIFSGDPGESLARKIIKPGTEDVSSLIKKMSKILPEDQMHDIGRASEGSRNLDGVDLNKLRQRITVLKPQQLRSLFPDTDELNKVLDFVKLKDLGQKQLSMKHNPETGATLKQILTGSGQIGGAAKAWSIGGPLAALASLIAPALGARTLGAINGSEAFRDWYIRQLNNRGAPASKFTNATSLGASKAASGYSPISSIELESGETFPYQGRR